MTFSLARPREAPVSDVGVGESAVPGAQGAAVLEVSDTAAAALCVLCRHRGSTTARVQIQGLGTATDTDPTLGVALSWMSCTDRRRGDVIVTDGEVTVLIGAAQAPTTAERTLRARPHGGGVVFALEPHPGEADPGPRSTRGHRSVGEQPRP